MTHMLLAFSNTAELAATEGQLKESVIIPTAIIASSVNQWTDDCRRGVFFPSLQRDRMVIKSKVSR